MKESFSLWLGNFILARIPIFPLIIEERLLSTGKCQDWFVTLHRWVKFKIPRQKSGPESGIRNRKGAHTEYGIRNPKSNPSRYFDISPTLQPQTNSNPLFNSWVKFISFKIWKFKAEILANRLPPNRICAHLYKSSSHDWSVGFW